MNDRELEKLWQENLRDEDFNKVKIEIARLKRVAPSNSFEISPSPYRFAPIFVTTLVLLLAILWKANHIPVDDQKVAETLQIASNMNYEVYDDYLMEDIL